VKGHQDEITTILTAEAILNIQADALADSVPIDTQSQQADHIILPAEQCTLFIDNKIVQSRYKSTIREAFTMPPYKAYIAGRHKWTHQKSRLVDWEVVTRAVSNFPVSPVQLTKLVHDKLPTNSELAKSKPGYSNKCHYCDAQETFSHLLQCSNPTSAAFRATCIESTAEYLQQRSIDETFIQAFRTSLEKSLDVELTHTHNHTQETVTNQEQLGKSALLKGFLSISWRQALIQIEHSSHQTPTELLAGLVRIIWHEQLQFWNNHVKAQNQTQSLGTHPPNVKLEYYRHRVRQLYTLKDKCLPGHQHQYFHSDVEEHLRNATASQLRQYLHHYEPAIQGSIQAVQRHQTRTLWSFPGFIRQRINETSQSLSPRDSPPSIQEPLPNQSYTRLLNGARGAPPHHRHTRWRTNFQPLATLRQFFSPKPP
jgi:hypothetical protein